ncbi:hypothetical protein C7B79_24450 [Chroococcidiopsis cubana CCALA 043]|nr:hypothetical protein C7B79_24450 [Chroococcidiopsis cubana CCALA 043]
MDTVRLVAESKEICLYKVLAPAAGSIVGNPNCIQQIVWNLLSNAIKFRDKDGSVQVVLECIDSRITISEIDTGKEIDPDFLPYVFDRFRQEDSSTTRKYGGLELGLAIVKHLTELHGGRVSATSEGIGKGATFTVSLPIGALPTQEKMRSGGISL